MAYVFKVEKDSSISNRILRLDLCRGINESYQFQGEYFMSSNILPLKDIQPYQVIEKSFR